MRDEQVKLYHGDCLEVMDNLIKEGVKVDFVLTDIPYGIINGMTQHSGQCGNYDNIQWDNIIPIQPMFERIEKILREKGVAILFSQGELTGKLRTQTIHNLPFLYSYFWLKNNAGTGLMANKAPLSHIEELSVFYKEYDKQKENPLRVYAKKIKNYIELIEGQAIEGILRYKYKSRSGIGFFYCDSLQFRIPTKKSYDFWIETWKINDLDYFIPYEEMVNINSRYQKIFNLPKGKKSKTNVLEYDKPSGKEQGLHPTQKPIKLLEDLIFTYTNPEDLVLDFTMGSGSTGVAAVNTNRRFIGIELDENYFNISKERIDKALELQQLN